MHSTEQKISCRASASLDACPRVYRRESGQRASRGSRGNWKLSLGAIIFFVCFYLHVWLFIEPRLIYNGFGTFITYPAFSTDQEFLTNSLSYPGGIAEYAGGFLSHLYYFSWLGALIITAVAFSLYLAGRILVRLSALRRPPGYGGQAGQALKIICYIPAIMLLIVHNRYESQLTVFLPLSAALWFSVAYEKLFPRLRSGQALRSGIARASVFVVMFALLYYIAGGASFVFALLAMIYEIFVGSKSSLQVGGNCAEAAAKAGRRIILGVLFLTIAIGTYLVPRYISDLQTEITNIQSLLTRLSYDPWIRNIVICTYFFFPLTLFAVGLWQESARRKTSVSKSKKRAKRKSSAAEKLKLLFQNNKFKWAIETTLPVTILIAGIFVSFDGAKKKLEQMDYFARNGMWPEVLQTASRIRPESYGFFCIHDITRALYYTGRLGDEMFFYPQHLSALLLTQVGPKELSARKFMKTSQLLLELGYTGGAEKDAFEFLEIVGNSPFILEHLAKIRMAKGQVEAAKVFLGVLSKDLIFGHRGREMLRRLDDDPELANDKTIQHIRSVMVEKDSDRTTLEADAFFYQLLDKNKNNRMAFEYMMAFYLLTGQTGKLVENIGHLNEMGYKRLPQHYEEAIVIYIMGTGGKDMDLHGWQVRPETLMQGAEFSRIYALNQRNIQNARAALEPNFGKSYFFYYIFELPKIIK